MAIAGQTNPFANLPAISFANFDVQAATNLFVQGWQQAWFEETGETIVLGPADRRYHFILSFIGFMISAYAQIDASAKQNLLPLASGGFLDNICAIFGSKRSARLPASGAVVQLQFTIASQPISTTIPHGTYVADTSGTGLVFSTNTDLLIPAYQTLGAVFATCTTVGSIGNGIPINAITYLLNWTNPVVTPTVTNTETTAGGAYTETDTAYAIRMFTVTDSYSNAGSYGAYGFFAQQADPSISQVAVSGPEDGLAPDNVLISVLCQNGTMPNSAVLANVLASCDALSTRDLCANVWAKAPSGVNFTVDVNYYVPSAQVNNLANIQMLIENAVVSFTNSVTQNLEANIDPSVLTQMLVDAGAIRVTVINPAYFISLKKYQVGVLTADPIVNYMGLD